MTPQLPPPRFIRRRVGCGPLYDIPHTVEQIISMSLLLTTEPMICFLLQGRSSSEFQIRPISAARWVVDQRLFAHLTHTLIRVHCAKRRSPGRGSWNDWMNR